MCRKLLHGTLLAVSMSLACSASEQQGSQSLCKMTADVTVSAKERLQKRKKLLAYLEAIARENVKIYLKLSNSYKSPDCLVIVHGGLYKQYSKLRRAKLLSKKGIMLVGWRDSRKPEVFVGAAFGDNKVLSPVPD